MGTETGNDKYKPRLRSFRFDKISSERFPPGEHRDEAEKNVRAKSEFEVGEVENSRLTVIGVVEINGTRGDDQEFVVSLRVRSTFDVGEGATTRACMRPDVFQFISAQLGPLMVLEARNQLSLLGLKNLILPFFDPFNGRVSLPDGEAEIDN